MSEPNEQSVEQAVEQPVEQSVEQVSEETVAKTEQAESRAEKDDELLAKLKRLEKRNAYLRKRAETWKRAAKRLREKRNSDKIETKKPDEFGRFLQELFG
jgi:DNA repair exonuclease SbcCD ATPase subunit